MALSSRSSLLLSAQMAAFASEAAARHHTPKARYRHPIGVIVPYDQLLTENIRDPDYVPYCGKCSLCQRLRRTESGFECPTCGMKANWDLTPFNNNVDVKYDETIEGWGTIPEMEPDPVKLTTYDWHEDEGKKNTETKHCGRCNHAFFGKRSRKFCFDCNPTAERLREQIQAANARKPSRRWT